MHYTGYFQSKEDICREFSISGFDGVVIYAAYDCADYEGSAQVIYINDGKLFTVSGGHCSCFGLEGQWEPEEMPLAALERVAQGQGSYADAARSLFWVMDNMAEDSSSDEAVALATLLAHQ